LAVGLFRGPKRWPPEESPLITFWVWRVFTQTYAALELALKKAPVLPHPYPMTGRAAS